MTVVVTSHKRYLVQETQDEVLHEMTNCQDNEYAPGMCHLTTRPPARSYGSVGIFIKAADILAVEYE